MDAVMIEQEIQENYFIMGRITTEQFEFQPLYQLISTKYTDCIVAEEYGEETGKRHFHFVVRIPMAHFKDAIVARESVRKWIKKTFNLVGNGKHSVKICLDPIKAIAYTMKEQRFETSGINTFFFSHCKQFSYSKCDEPAKSNLKKDKEKLVKKYIDNIIDDETFHYELMEMYLHYDKRKSDNVFFTEIRWYKIKKDKNYKEDYLRSMRQKLKLYIE